MQKVLDPQFSHFVDPPPRLPVLYDQSLIDLRSLMVWVGVFDFFKTMLLERTRKLVATASHPKIKDLGKISN